ncbi:type VI secretion protein ImpB [Salipiger sp. IMCC34102]|uniref:Y-family DNA polymerase n=1 Tax=Salipiger sp. IMCC34102 TaxID=2510647 RepID=UPI00101C8AB7|nr:type VI secretion protein ImpB [Salipiger sp. IMCC34102]RYH00728.1 type VI secretion protein ImpB [Salipiger sp. IMCC34102]
MIQDPPGQARGIERLYLDFDSFFASAEQHFNSDLRGRPVGVVPLDALHTGCIAISREAKARGVKFNMPIVKAREIIPDMIFVVARHDVYVRLHKRILDVIETVVPVAHVRSIDEVVCTLLAAEGARGEDLALQLKAALAAAFSDVLTCSIGMAPTELLAKIAAEQHKPNGFKLIRANDLPQALATVDLGDLPGISKGMQARLEAAGVRDFTGLWALAPKQARAIWGSVEGERFWNGLHGYHAERPATKKSMFGHSRILPQDWRNPQKVSICARLLTQSAGRRVRRANVRATKLTLGFKAVKPRGGPSPRADEGAWTWEGSFAPARDDHTFLGALGTGLAEAERRLAFTPKSVSVMIHGLIDEAEIVTDLFSMSPSDNGGSSETADRAKWEKVSDLMDGLRAKLGPQALSMGPQAEVPGGYVGAKIAFGRIPDEEDFSGPPVADAATHFATF